ncbi:MAG: hypothetical protein NTW95_05770, partial [Candidatus Aminicenantes bacterium]|nr:hypothetical protein [Candidatus Aminicenantes bacterium]
MKKTIYGAAFLVIFVWLTYFFFGQQEIEREYVQVLNIEMLVRVMKDGRPLAGLQKRDFSLFENGQKQEINGFLEVHRRITPGETGEKAKAEKEARPGRLFLLFFWINDPAVKVGEVLNYFFNSIYREGDRVILADQRHSLEINSTAEKDARVAEFKAGLSVLSGDLLTARRRFKSDIEACLQLYITCLDAQNNTKYPPRCDPETVALQYAQLLKEYRMQNLTPNANQLEAMSRSLEAIDADKWALVFFQHDTLPLFNTEKLKLEDYHLRLGSTINSIDKVNRDLLFPVEASLLADSLRSRFIQTNTQFHLLLLDRQQTPTDVDPTSRFGVVNPFPVFSNWEKTFRQMAEATGGEIMDGNQMKEALDEVAGREDVYYVFTYAPTAGKNRERRIDIQVGRESVQVIHGRRLEMETLPQIRLTAIESVPGKVHLDLENIYMIGRGGLRS